MEGSVVASTTGKNTGAAALREAPGGINAGAAALREALMLDFTPASVESLGSNSIASTLSFGEIGDIGTKQARARLLRFALPSAS